MSVEKIRVMVEGYGDIDVDKNISLLDLSKRIFENDYKKYLGAIINNEVRHLGYRIEESCRITFIDLNHKDGRRIYARTLSFIYVKACNDIFKNCEVTIEHSLSKGIYSEIHKESLISKDDTIKIMQRMKEIIEEDYEISREEIDKEEAIEIFTRQNMQDKVRLLNHVAKTRIHIYRIGDLYDTYYGYLAPSTGYIDEFNLVYYCPGIVLQYPIKETNLQIPDFEEHPKLFKIFRESEKWGDILDIGYVGALNDKIKNEQINEIIRISEALHEKKIANIADKICENDAIRIILIAGPSSSGKTTFAERLGIQLKVNGKKPISISVDDYFVNREDTPLDEHGEYDFEAIEAVDLELFNRDLSKLLAGEEVEVPTFNFVLGKREYNGKKIKIDEEHPIIIEGIHCLNNRLTESIPQENKYKIYISALTQLNLDSHNRIHTTDTRLIRRMVRDYKYRGYSAEMTLERWDSVRRGEEKNIFPYQEEADAMFNSSLVYDLSVLKKYAEPLLREISKTSSYYKESKRLLRFLSYFIDIKDEQAIPCTSIVREFIGGSCF
ncbi:uridine kinase [Proteiniborus sp. DW1]|uniref:nucleoside kinase n=1 Tax=Proteiniborus sp. DW1 TaxID=1889883 RepID=UPI00092DFACC|nr:nucleoside kinase [Proteiniborus sp. DW1]SCG82959.1 uridine kinase [Proteiniborus sp. DW1]